MWKCSKCETLNDEEYCKICGERCTISQESSQPVRNLYQQQNQWQNGQYQQGNQWQNDQNQQVNQWQNDQNQQANQWQNNQWQQQIPQQMNNGYDMSQGANVVQGGFMGENNVQPMKKGFSKGMVAVCVMLGVVAMLLCVVAAMLAMNFTGKFDFFGETEKEQVEIVENGEEIIDNGEEDAEMAESEDEKPVIDTERLESIANSDVANADVSVCVIDLKNGETYKTTDADNAYSASAMINVPVLYVALKKIDEGSYYTDTQMQFRHRVAGRGTLKSDVDGEYFDLKYLLAQMLRYSDNNVTNSLMDGFGRDNINRICRADSFDSVNIQRYIGEESTKDNYISATDLARMVAELYTSDNWGSEFLKDNFRIDDNASNDGLVKGVPVNVMFLNHNALTNTTYCEVAVVSSAKTEYVIAFMSNNGKFETSMNTASRVSDFVYSSLNN